LTDSRGVVSEISRFCPHNKEKYNKKSKSPRETVKIPFLQIYTFNVVAEMMGNFIYCPCSPFDIYRYIPFHGFMILCTDIE
jgi:ubiquinone/menaquinone biosynthesis C-methylase UbiE